MLTQTHYQSSVADRFCLHFALRKNQALTSNPHCATLVITAQQPET